MDLINNLRKRAFWIWIALKEINKHGKTDYNIFSLIFGRIGG